MCVWEAVCTPLAKVRIITESEAGLIGSQTSGTCVFLWELGLEVSGVSSKVSF